MDQVKIYFEQLPLIISGRLPEKDTSRIVTQPVEVIPAVTASLKQGDATPLFLYAEEPMKATEAIFENFEKVSAGGGLVHNQSGDYLLIYRRNHWDLPKGKQDEGELIEACALREVEEETGLDRLTIIRPLPPTWHVYKYHGIDTLKKTSWFLMQHHGNGVVKVQTEEDIEEGRWVAAEDLKSYFSGMYLLIRDLITDSGIH